MILAGIILLVMIYSLVFSPKENKFPVVCQHQLLTGKPCPTCGLSHSFSSMVRLQWKEAGEFNPFGIRIFLFFFIQFFLRLFFSIAQLKAPSRTRLILWTD